MTEIKTLSLMKGKQHFCFRYQPGDEAHVLDALVEMVNRRELSFDWFDAAVMSHQLGQQFSQRIEGIFAEESGIRNDSSFRT